MYTHVNNNSGHIFAIFEMNGIRRNLKSKVRISQMWNVGCQSLLFFISCIIMLQRSFDFLKFNDVLHPRNIYF